MERLHQSRRPGTGESRTWASFVGRTTDAGSSVGCWRPATELRTPPPMWADGDAQTAHAHLLDMEAALRGIKPQRQRALRIERVPRKRTRWAAVDTERAVAAVGLNRRARRPQRRIGEHRHPASPGAHRWRHQQAVSTDPAQACHPGHSLVADGADRYPLLEPGRGTDGCSCVARSAGLPSRCLQA